MSLSFKYKQLAVPLTAIFLAVGATGCSDKQDLDLEKKDSDPAKSITVDEIPEMNQQTMFAQTDVNLEFAKLLKDPEIKQWMKANIKFEMTGKKPENFAELSKKAQNKTDNFMILMNTRAQLTEFDYQQKIKMLEQFKLNKISSIPFNSSWSRVKNKCQSQIDITQNQDKKTAMKVSGCMQTAMK